jgi:hypothetical protein
MLQTVQLLLITSLPALLTVSDMFAYSERIVRFTAILWSSAAAILTVYMQMSRLGSQWQQYRLVAEQLKKEFTAFSMDVGEYRGIPPEEKQRQFVERSESLFENELSRWFVGEPSLKE